MELLYGMFTLPDPLSDEDVVDGICSCWVALMRSLLPA